MKRLLMTGVCFGIVLLSTFALTLWLVGMPRSFYDFNLMQAITPAVQIAIAIGLAFFVNIKLSNQSKRNELLISKLEQYESSIGQLHGFAMEYMENKKSDLEPEILHALKDVSKHIDVLKKIDDHFDFKLSYAPRDMEKDFIDYKKSLTGESFKQKGVTYSTGQKNRVEKIRNRMEERIMLQKLKLYS